MADNSVSRTITRYGGRTMFARTIVLVCVALGFTASFAHAAPPKADSTADAKAEAGKDKKPRTLTAIQTDARAALTAEAKSRRAGNNTPDVLQIGRAHV